jgi:hypothetical protein
VKRRYSLELTDGLPPEIYSRVEAVQETRTRTAPRMERDVTRPAQWVGCGSFVAAAGALLAVGGFSITVMGVAIPWPVWLLAGGFSLLIGAGAFIAVYLSGLAYYRRMQVEERRYRLKEPPRESDGRIYARKPGQENTTMVGQYNWTRRERADFSRRLFDDRGRWTAGDAFRRQLIEGVIKNYTQHYPNIRDDFAALGWIDDNGFWLPEAVPALRQWLFISAQDSPTPNR